MQFNPSCRTSVTKTLAEFRRTHEEAGLSEVRTVVSVFPSFSLRFPCVFPAFSRRFPGVFPVSPRASVLARLHLRHLARGSSAAVSWMDAAQGECH